jgi:hypothetical protein
MGEHDLPMEGYEQDDLNRGIDYLAGYGRAVQDMQQGEDPDLWGDRIVAAHDEMQKTGERGLWDNSDRVMVEDDNPAWRQPDR